MRPHPQGADRANLGEHLVDQPVLEGREQPPRDNPVARALLDRALRPLLEALREEEASSPLVRP